MANYESKINELYTPESITGMGFQNAKEFEKYSKKAMSEWKKTKRQITYSDDLSNGEVEMLLKDPNLAKLMKEIEDKNREAVELIQNKVVEYRIKMKQLEDQSREVI